MSRKKVKNLNVQDFTIHDCANAPKKVTRLKKAAVTETLAGDKSWDQICIDDFDVIEELETDGTKKLVFHRKRNTRSCLNTIDDRPGVVYPEIVWYHIAQYIKPEDVGRFAGINKSTYTITRHKSFWRMLYKKYCANHPKLPEKLQVNNSYRLYGLKQRVIRALYCTYDVFIKRLAQQATQDSSPHELIKRRCVNVWYNKGSSYWLVFFKLKKLNLLRQVDNASSFIEKLGKIDANPEENSQVLQVTCQNFYEVPPLMGMTLSSVKLLLEQGFTHHRLLLGFSTSHHNISRNVIPDCSVVLDTVIKILVYDWWHPKYPYFEDRLPADMFDDKSLPVLKKDFFSNEKDEDV